VKRSAACWAGGRAVLCADFAAEPLTGGLPGHSQGGGDPVPAPPVRPGQGDAFGEQRLIPAGAFGGFGDRAQVGEVFHLCRLRVEFAGERFEPACGFLDLLIGISSAERAGPR
jgi:hypothetical protein